MKLTEQQANTIFDILLEKGNHPVKYADYSRFEFVHKMTNEGAHEHWYSSECGSSIKLYFTSKIYVYAQTINITHEKTLVADVNKALDEFVASQQG